MSNEVSKVYLLTDTHFFHDKMQKFCDRPADFGEKIIKQWRVTVQPQDLVYHLGDVTWGNREQLQQIMSSLPGTKILVRGNHDRNHSNNWFMQVGFAAVVEKVQVSGVILSHFPTELTQEEIDYGIINIHGHFHNNDPKKWEQKFKKRITSSHFLMILENIEYRPVDLQKARKGKFVYNSKKLLESESEYVKKW
jgi:calcineurin-like phosphoesterase family protein